MGGLGGLVSLLLLAVVAANEATDYPADSYDLEDTTASTFVGGDGTLNDFGYGTDGLEYDGYPEDGASQYYKDEFDEYYSQYGMYASEYDLDYFEREGAEPDCTQDKDGKVRLSGVQSTQSNETSHCLSCNKN